MRFVGCIIVGLVLAGCDALGVPPIAMECPAMGCDSQVVFELQRNLDPGETYDVEACVDDRCFTAEVTVSEHGFAMRNELVLDGDQVVLVLPAGDYRGTRRVSLALRGPRGESTDIETETEFARVQPNGEQCEPTCWQATIDV